MCIAPSLYFCPSGGLPTYGEDFSTGAVVNFAVLKFGKHWGSPLVKLIASPNKKKIGDRDSRSNGKGQRLVCTTMFANVYDRGDNKMSI